MRATFEAHLRRCKQCRETPGLCEVGAFYKRKENNESKPKKPQVFSSYKAPDGGNKITAWVGSPELAFKMSRQKP